MYATLIVFWTNPAQQEFLQALPHPTPQQYQNLNINQHCKHGIYKHGISLYLNLVSNFLHSRIKGQSQTVVLLVIVVETQ